MTKACVLLAQGFEEIEAITAIDVLRRAGVQTRVVALAERLVRGSHDITVQADCTLRELADERWDLVYLPGGQPGANHLSDDPRVIALVQRQVAEQRPVAAICAAPIVLERAGVLTHRHVTSYPGVRQQLRSAQAYSEERVVMDGPIVTSRGAGTALALALELVALLVGADAADKLRSAMIAD